MTTTTEQQTGASDNTIGLPLEFHDEVELVSLKPALASADLIEKVEEIPNKMAFKIGEAAEIVGVKQYVLRFWETEFDQLRPKKSKNNQRVYSRRDIETSLLIKKLLYQDRFSIEGARAVLRSARQQLKEEKGVKVQVQKATDAVSRIESLISSIDQLKTLFA